jgi:hypothetical protein
MSLLVTIFGGMLLTALLYGVASRTRLSNFWSAVLAAGLPSVAYLVYAFAHWPGLDVVTMHVVAFPTVSLLLYLLYEGKPGESKKIHWVPKLLIAFFVVLTALLGCFVYIAVNGLPPAVTAIVLPNAKGKIVHTGFAGVVEHGEEAANGISVHRDIEARLAKLGWHVEVDGLQALSSTRVSEIKVLLRGADGHGVAGQKLAFALYRPGQHPPAGKTMREMADGDYRTNVELPDAGFWTTAIEIDAAGKRITLEHSIGTP